MKESVIVSAARTPVDKVCRGGFNNPGGTSLVAAGLFEVA